MKTSTGLHLTPPPPEQAPPAAASPLPLPPKRFFAPPRTRLGWWSAGLFAAFVLMFLVNAFFLMPASIDAGPTRILLIFFGLAMLACGLASGIISLLAILRRGERSWLVWLPLLPAFWVIFMLLGELVFPH